MTIQLPKDVENSIRAEVLGGHFASVDDAIAEAWRSFLQHKKPTSGSSELGSIGSMSDAAEELDQAVEHAMNFRQRPWRVLVDE